MRVDIIVLRTLQALFGVIVLAISANLARDQKIGNTPSTTSYDAFTGGFAIIACPLGMAALGVEFLAPISLIVDGLVAVTSLAGGIATAVQLRGTHCGNIDTIYYNDLLNGGLVNVGGEMLPDLTAQQMQSRCNADKANTAFMFLGFIASVVVLALSFQSYKRTK